MQYKNCILRRQNYIIFVKYANIVLRDKRRRFNFISTSDRSRNKITKKHAVKLTKSFGHFKKKNDICIIYSSKLKIKWETIRR